MATGTDYKNAIAGKAGAEREQVALDYFAQGAMPPFSTAVVPLVIEEVIGGQKHKLVLEVATDAFAVGSSLDPFYAPLWPTTAQTIADSLGAILPSRKLARLIYEAAPVKLTLYGSNPGEPWYDMKTGTPRKIEDSGAWAASNPKKVALTRLALKGNVPGTVLVAGHSKDVITGPTLDGSRVRIYGGGGGKTDGWAVQPPSTIHDWNYGPDYSHSTRFIRRNAVLDGKAVDLYDVFADPVLSALVSDEGPYTPRIPNPKKSTKSPALNKFPPGIVPVVYAENEEGGDVFVEGQASRSKTGDFLFLGVVGVGLYALTRMRPV